MNGLATQIQEQNRLLAEQNALLLRIANANSLAEQESGDGVMTDQDCLLICMADNILQAIDNWNLRCKQRRRRR